MRYKLELAYHGGGFKGWQKQDDSPGIQGVLEEKLSMLLREDIVVYGCGRTDTGVHARYFVAHFDTQHAVPENITYRLNGMLPKGIAVFTCNEVSDDFHARFSAISRTYEYLIIHKKDPFSADLKWHNPFIPDLQAMNEAAKLLLNHEEYRCFCKGKAPKDNYKCTVTEAFWSAGENNDELVFRISANRFLRSMVRSTVGTLLKVGYGKMSLAEFEQLLHSGNRSDAGKSVPAHGLYLVDVSYPVEEHFGKA